jgi:hypothetical protein
MLTVIKGPTSYNDLMKIGDTQYTSYRDACFAMGFLEDDKEYINAIKQAKDWGSGYFLRRLFVVMLLANTMNRPRHVWDETKVWLCDGILYQQKIIANNRGMDHKMLQLLLTQFHLILNTLNCTYYFRR